MICQPVPRAEREERFGHYRKALPGPDAARITIPRSKVEGYLLYEREVQERKAKGWRDTRDQDALEEADRRWQESEKCFRKGKVKSQSGNDSKGKSFSKGSSSSTWSINNWSAAGAAAGWSSWYQGTYGMPFDTTVVTWDSQQMSSL